MNFHQLLDILLMIEISTISADGIKDFYDILMTKNSSTLWINHGWAPYELPDERNKRVAEL